MSFLEELAIAKFPKLGCVYRLKLTGQPVIKYLKTGTRFDIPEAVFYDSSSPPQAILSRPITIWADGAGDLMHVLEAYGTEQYSQLYAVKVVPRFPGATTKVKFEMELSECRRLEDFRCASSDGSGQMQQTVSTVPTAISTAVRTVGSPSPTGMRSDPAPPPPSAVHTPPGAPAQPETAGMGSNEHFSAGFDSQPRRLDTGQAAPNVCSSCGKPTGGFSYCPHCGGKQ